ncbi:MAG: dockerin type I domain-containing protein [Pirellulales bacterium]
MSAKNHRDRRASFRHLLILEVLESRQLLATLIERPVVNVSDLEQLLVEQINVARADPQATADRLKINLNEGLDGAQRVTADAKAPLAIRQPLEAAASKHSLDMLVRGYFEHVSPDGKSTPITRAVAEGYLQPVGENIAVRSVLQSLTTELLALHDQLFLSPLHRVNLLRSDYTDVGPGVEQGDFRYSNGGVYQSLMATELFGLGTAAAITGVVFDDLTTADGDYDVGEGVAGAVIEATTNGGTIYRTRSGASGGYTLDVPPGVYTVTVSGAPLSAAMTRANVGVSFRNVKIDFDASASVSGLVGGSLPADLRPLDASGDGIVTPRDALLVLNYLIDERQDFDATLDTNRDGVIAPLDVLFVVNYLNSDGEGEFAATDGSVEAVRLELGEGEMASEFEPLFVQTVAGESEDAQPMVERKAALHWRGDSPHAERNGEFLHWRRVRRWRQLASVDAWFAAF